jgi:mono/diheme cytochrome c family protein
VYTKKCASCHGKEGEGNPTMAKMLKADIRPLSANEVQSKSDDQLRKDIVEGTGKMKAVTGLADADVANLVAYVRSLAK